MMHLQLSESQITLEYFLIATSNLIKFLQNRHLTSVLNLLKDNLRIT